MTTGKTLRKVLGVCMANLTPYFLWILGNFRGERSGGGEKGGEGEREGGREEDEYILYPRSLIRLICWWKVFRTSWLHVNTFVFLRCNHHDFSSMILVDYILQLKQARHEGRVLHTSTSNWRKRSEDGLHKEFLVLGSEHWSAKQHWICVIASIWMIQAANTIVKHMCTDLYM